MRPPRSLIVYCSLLVLFISAVGQSGGQTANMGVQPAQLLSHTINENWPSYNGDYTGRRFSSLTQITPENVGQLRAEWVFHSRNSSKLEVTPVVVDGVMYITASNDVYALNSTNGRTLWHYSRPVSSGLIDDAAGHINRGVALLGTRLYTETDNAHLVCLDARSGHLLWDIAYADWNKNYGATSVPLIIKDKVLVGTSGGDSGVRGFLAAYDATSGKLVWRLWTIPGPGEFGSSSWPGDSYLHGGGTTWMPGTYDPELNTVYWGTGNAGPDYDGDVRPGDDLYTACLLAIDPDNGKLKWYFQFTPHDLYDYDGVETPVLIDRVYQGTPRRLLVEANRNGYLYVLDRADGKFLSATQFAVRLNWAKGIDANGRPIVSGLQPTSDGTLICPGDIGGTNWFSPSYSEFTHQFYLSAFNICSTYFKKPAVFAEGSNYYSTGTTHDSKDRGKKELLAFDLDKNSFTWRYPQEGDSHSWGGVMTTASGLVFFADDAESFEAVDAMTGKSLWHFNTGQTFHASPMSYSVSGKQYVAIASGDDLFSFALP
ncbi:MAG TPA: PQQ-dependent dehydrogenase, methanol/ethanol family [Terriglobales bacterium]|nr:PQQ-dependent dehydrogenase, methanol/ethanol family [Terriglobales bacterium]